MNITGVYNITIYEHRRNKNNKCGPLDNEEPFSHVFVKEMQKDKLYVIFIIIAPKLCTSFFPLRLS